MQSAEAIIHFELKYCERCGGLWLRPCEAAAVYCSPCARQMAEVARRLQRRSGSAKSGAALTTACGVALLQPRLDAAAGCGA